MGGRAGRELRPEAVLAWARSLARPSKKFASLHIILRPSMSVVKLLSTLLRMRECEASGMVRVRA